MRSGPYVDPKWEAIIVELAKGGMTLNRIEIYLMETFEGPLPSRSYIYSRARNVPGFKREKPGRGGTGGGRSRGRQHGGPD